MIATISPRKMSTLTSETRLDRPERTVMVVDMEQRLPARGGRRPRSEPFAREVTHLGRFRHVT